MAGLLDLCCGSGARRGAQNSAGTEDKGAGREAESSDTSIAKVVETKLAQVEKSVVAIEKSFEPGQPSSRVREQSRQEMAREHPEVHASLLDQAWKAGGLDKPSDPQKQEELNQNRTGRYKKKFV
jgi:hypothetical protein